MLAFVEGGKPEYPETNPRSRDENQQQTQPTYGFDTRNRTRPHWWKASALTTEPSLLPAFPALLSTFSPTSIISQVQNKTLQLKIKQIHCKVIVNIFQLREHSSLRVLSTESKIQSNTMKGIGRKVLLSGVCSNSAFVCLFKQTIAMITIHDEAY